MIVTNVVIGREVGPNKRPTSILTMYHPPRCFLSDSKCPLVFTGNTSCVSEGALGTWKSVGLCVRQKYLMEVGRLWYVLVLRSLFGTGRSVSWVESLTVFLKR